MKMIVSLGRFKNIELRVMQTGFPVGIRRARAEDLDDIERIEKKCFPGRIAYSRRQLAHLCLRANSSCLLETNGNTIRGFIIVTYRQGSNSAGLETIDVDPSFKKQGIGVRLLAAAHMDMKQHHIMTSQLEVSEGNERAIQLYKKAGYVEIERVSNYYLYEHNGTRNAIRMVKVF
jgi:[ribosomal protein S18]-alanine N-acetyltransferase